jgi:hypothetical protein
MPHLKIHRLGTFLLVLGAVLPLVLGCASRSDDDPSDFMVITVSPGNGQSNVTAATQIVLRFSEPVDHRTVIGTQQIILADQSNAIVPISYQFQGENIIITPASPLASSSTYGVAVRPGVRDIYGSNIEKPFAALFSTGNVVGSIPNWPPFTWNPPSAAPGFTPQSFTMVGQLWVPRQRHRAALLDSGKVLICGGLTTTAITSASRSAELYDPTTRTWSLSQSNSGRGMHFVRYDHSILKLNNGHILVTGGGDNISIWDTCEEYNPLTDNFSLWSARMQSPRAGHTTALLANGNPIALGGVDNAGALQTTMEVFDYKVGGWVLVGTSFGGVGALGRAFHSTTTLANGDLLNSGGNWNNADLYKPGAAAGPNGIAQCTGTNMSTGRTGHTASLLTSGYGSGLVVVIGGWRSDTQAAHSTNTAELYDHSQTVINPVINGNQGVWTPVGQTMFFDRHWHTANILPNGKILVIGGYTDRVNPRGSGAEPPSVTALAEMFDPFNLGYNVNAPFSGINLTGNFDWTRDVQGNQIQVPNSHNPPGPPPPPGGLWKGLADHTATTMLDGSVLIVGGIDYDWRGAYGFYPRPPFFPHTVVSGLSFVYAP